MRAVFLQPPCHHSGGGGVSSSSRATSRALGGSSIHSTCSRPHHHQQLQACVHVGHHRGSRLQRVCMQQQADDAALEPDALPQQQPEHQTLAAAADDGDTTAEAAHFAGSSNTPLGAAAAAASDDLAASSADAGSSGKPPPGPQQQKQTFTYFYTHTWPHVSQPVPVQLPPPGAWRGSEPAKPFFNYAKYFSPGFLRYYPAPPGSSYNYLSFLGEADPHKGKFLAVGSQLDQFLSSYFNSITLVNRRMYLAESYNGQPFKFYQELDFPWLLDPQLVLQLVPRVVDIVTQEVARVYAEQIPPGVTIKPVLSMRTIYKVHLNFPGINTMEIKAGVVRKAVINRCRAELSGQPPLDKLKQELVQQEHWLEAQAVLLQLQQTLQQLREAGQEPQPEAQRLLEQHRELVESAQQQLSSSSSDVSQAPQAAVLPQPQQEEGSQQSQPQSPSEQQPQEAPSFEQQQQQLDWESIVDFPHGSLRLLGSCKAPWMDSDPVWVTEKSYGRVECVGGVWMRQPLSLGSVMECSILLGEGELRVFEQTEEFLDVTFQAAQQHQQELAAKRVKRNAKKWLQSSQQQLTQPHTFASSKQQQQQPDGDLADGDAAQAQAATQEQRRAAKALRKLEAEQRAAEEAKQKQEAERKRAEALARLQAAAASSVSQRKQAPLLAKPTRPAIVPPQATELSQQAHQQQPQPPPVTPTGRP